MSDKEIVKEEHSKKNKGHGPGKQVMPGANRCGPAIGKGQWEVVATNPLKFNVRRGTKA
jgi:hypothetical protein